MNWSAYLKRLIHNWSFKIKWKSRLILNKESQINNLNSIDKTKIEIVSYLTKRATTTNFVLNIVIRWSDYIKNQIVGNH